MKATESTLSPEILTILAALAVSIRDSRKRRRLRQVDLARRAGIGRATVQRMERGDPGTALGAYLEALIVIDRAILERVKNALLEDPAATQLMNNQLGKRVRLEELEDDDF